jgi:type IV secretion system protein VirD4
MDNGENIILGLPITKRAQESGRRYERPYRTMEDIDLIAQGTRSRFRAERSVPVIEYTDDSHLMTIAPTGAGKGRSVIIPNLLTYSGPVIVVDPKGENYNVTSKARAKMGQEIIKLDPFGVTDEHDDRPTDSFNPFDILPFTKNVSDEARMLAELVMVERMLSKEPFWENWASLLISGLVLFLAYLEEETSKYRRSFIGVRDLLYGDDPTYSLAMLLDTLGKKMEPEAYQNIATILSIKADVTRSGVLASAQQFFTIYGTDAMKRVLETTSFDIKRILRGDPISIYIIIPPSKLVSHRSLFRLWVGALLSLFASRKSIPDMNTLFLIDEAAQLGHLEQLQTAKTLLRGYGLQTWSFWQDFSQIKHLYPNWETMVNNSAVLQVFGAKNHMVAQEFARIVGAEALEVRRIAPDEQILVINGEEPIRSRKFDYLNDERFAGKFSPNPLYKSELTPEAYEVDYLALQRQQRQLEREQAKAEARQKAKDRASAPRAQSRSQPRGNPFDKPTNEADSGEGTI